MNKYFIMIFVALALSGCSPNYYAMGYRFFKQKKHEETIRCLERYIGEEHTSSDKAAALFMIAMSYADLGDSSKGVEYYTKALEMKPNFVYARFNRAMLYINLQNYEKALLDLDVVVELIKNKSFEELKNDLWVDIKNFPEKRKIFYVYRLMLNLQLGKYNIASDDMNFLTKNYYCDSSLVVSLSKIYLCDGPLFNPDEVIRLCQLNSKNLHNESGSTSKVIINDDIILVLAKAHALKSDYEKALEILSHISKTNVQNLIMQFREKKILKDSLTTYSNDFFNNHNNKKIIYL